MDWVYLPFAFPVWTVCTTGESTKLDLSVDMMWTASPAVVCVRYRYFLLDGSVMEFRLASLFLCRVTLLHVDPSVHRMIEPNQTSLLPRYSRTTSDFPLGDVRFPFATFHDSANRVLTGNKTTGIPALSNLNICV